MKVYLKTEERWNDFINGGIVIAHRKPIKGYYKEVSAKDIKVINLELNTLTITKKD